MMNFYSQDGQDQFLYRLFKNKRDGFFLDIGAHNGVEYSNTYFLEKTLGWKGICIEPNPVVYKQLAKNRNCVCLNCCVSNIKGELQFLAVKGYGEMLSGLVDMFDERHLERIDREIATHGGSREVIRISGLPLMDILSSNNLKYIDYCNIDIEGGELTILKTIDFSKVHIHVFSIENNYEEDTVSIFMRSKGYRKIAKLGSDEIYEFRSLRYNLMIQLWFDKQRRWLADKKRRLLQ